MIQAGYHYYLSKPWLGGLPEDPVVPITGTAPTPNKGVGKTAKLAALTLKEDKAFRIGKKVKTIFKYGKGFDSGDARAINSGQSRIQNSLIRLAIELMSDPVYNVLYAKEYNRLKVKLAKATNPENQARIKTEIRNLAKRFIEEGWLH